MKKTLTKIGACLMAAVIFAGASLTAEASEIEPAYSYIYDIWEDVQECPDFYEVTKVLASSDLGLDKNMLFPSGLYAHNDRIYVMDSGNNRILEFQYVDYTLKYVRTIDSIKGNVEVKDLNSPTDIAVSEDGNIFIADQGNARILKLDSNLNYIMQFNIPVDNALDKDLVFKPSKIVVDTAERVYCCAIGINKGLVKYEADGKFSGFVGATPVTFDFLDYLQKKFATQAQRELMVSFVPTEYDNVYMDKEGFIYAITTDIDELELKNGNIDAIRKLNLLGSDILVRNGEYPVYGDIYMGTGGGYTGPSHFADATVFDNDIYVCVDSNRGRLFAYNDQGVMVFAMGGNGNMDGYFKKAISVEHIGYTLFVLDYTDGSITIFNPTEFGNLVYQAIDLFDQGNYNASGECWEKAMQLDGNYDLAYIGIGRARLRQKRYKEAMEFFELKLDDENYSKAYKQYRKIWVEDHIVIIVIVILAAFLIPGTINKVKSIKREIETADIFKV